MPGLGKGELGIPNDCIAFVQWMLGIIVTEHKKNKN